MHPSASVPARFPYLPRRGQSPPMYMHFRPDNLPDPDEIRAAIDRVVTDPRAEITQWDCVRVRNAVNEVCQQSDPRLIVSTWINEAGHMELGITLVGMVPPGWAYS